VAHWILNQALSLAAIGISIIALLIARRSTRIAEAAHKFQLRPHVVPMVAVRQPVDRLTGSYAELVLVNPGSGTAINVLAELRIARAEGEVRLEPTRCLALAKGDEHIVPGIPQTGRVDILGTIAFEDMEKNHYLLTRASQNEEWHQVKRV